MQSLDVATPDVETSGDLPVVDIIENTSTSAGWVIGPLFQSLKSKMASFTEIVMSPVKLFRAGSPPPSIDCLNPPSDSERVDAGGGDVFHPGALIESKNLDSRTDVQGLSDCGDTQSTETVDSEQVSSCSGCEAESAISQKDSVPLAGVLSESFGSFVLQSLAIASASQKTDLKPSSAELTAPSGPVSRNGSESKSINSEDKQSPCDSRDVIASVCYPQPLCLQLQAAESQNNRIDETNKPSSKTQSQQDPELSSVSDVVRPKRALKPSCHSQDSAKRKKVTDSAETPPIFHVASRNDVIKGLRASRRGEASTNTTTREEEMIKLDKKRAAALTKSKNKGKDERAVIIPQTGSSSEAILICSLEKNSLEPRDKAKGGRAKPTGSSTKLKTRKTPCKADNQTGMDLETTEVLVRPNVKCSDANKMAMKRKLTRGGRVADGSLSTSSSEPMTLDFSSSQGAQRDAVAPSRPSKRSRNGLRGAGGSPGFSQTQEAKKQIGKFNKENRTDKSDSAYFEMTLVGRNPQLNLDCYVQLNKDVSIASVDEIFLTDAELAACARPGARDAVTRRRQADNHRRRIRATPGLSHRGEEGSKSVTAEDAGLVASESGFSMRLLRSYSCPEIPSLRAHDSAWTSPSSSPPSRTRVPPHHEHPASHRSPRRARRHTVCSVEVEREIAPLCLRKEVYPSRRSFSPALHLSPSTALSALASRFLSSPLAFLSKKTDCNGDAACPSHASSPSSSSVSSPSTWRPLVFTSTANSAAALGSCSR